MALTRSGNSINSFENFKTSYGGTAAYQALGGDKGFSDALATNNSNYINSYISVLMDADQLGGIAAFKADYNTNFLSNNDRLTAAVNELYGDRTELKDYTRYKQDEDGNYVTDDDGNYVEETYQDTEYNYTKEVLQSRAAAEKQQYEYQLADEAKESWSGWRKFWAGVGSLFGHIAGTFLDTIIDSVMYIGLGIISIGRRGTLQEYYTRTGWFQNYGAGFFADLMDDYDITYTTLVKADGTVTNMGSLVAGIGNTLGAMLPSMIINLVMPGGGSISSAASVGAKIGAVATKIVKQGTYWYGLYVESIKDYMKSSPNITFNQASLAAFTVTAVQAAVTLVNAYLVYGGSYFDKLTLGINKEGFVDAAVSQLRSGKYSSFFNNGVVRFVTDVLTEGFKQWQEEEWQEMGQYIVEDFYSHTISGFNRVFELSGQQYLNAMTMSFITSSITIGFRYVGTAINRIDNYKEISVKNTKLLNEDGTIKEGHSASELIFKSSKGTISQTLTMKETEQQFMQWANDAEKIIEKYANVKVVTDENGNKHKEYELTSEISDKDKKKLKTIATALTNAAQIIGQYYNAVGDEQFKAAMSTLDQIAEESEQRKRIVANGGYVQYANAMIQRAHHSAEIKGLAKLGPKLTSQRISQVAAWLALDDAVLNATNLKGEAKPGTGATGEEGETPTAVTTNLAELRQKAIDLRQEELKQKEVYNEKTRLREEVEQLRDKIQEKYNQKQEEITEYISTAEYKEYDARIKAMEESIANVKNTITELQSEREELSNAITRLLASGASTDSKNVVAINERIKEIDRTIQTDNELRSNMENNLEEARQDVIGTTFNDLVQELNEINSDLIKAENKYDSAKKEEQDAELLHAAANTTARQAEWNYYNQRLTDIRKSAIDNTNFKKIREQRQAEQNKAQAEWDNVNKEIRELKQEIPDLKIEADAKKIAVDALIKDDPEIKNKTENIRELQQEDKDNRGLKTSTSKGALAYRESLAQQIRGLRKRLAQVANTKYADEIADMREAQKKYKNAQNRLKMLQRSLPKIKSNLDTANANAKNYPSELAAVTAAKMREDINGQISEKELEIKVMEEQLKRARKSTADVKTERRSESKLTQTHDVTQKEYNALYKKNSDLIKQRDNDIAERDRLSAVYNSYNDYEAYYGDEVPDWVSSFMETPDLDALNKKIEEENKQIAYNNSVLERWRKALKETGGKALVKSVSRLENEIKIAQTDLQELKRLRDVFNDWIAGSEQAYHNFINEGEAPTAEAPVTEETNETPKTEIPNTPKEQEEARKSKYDADGYVIPEIVSAIAEANIDERDKNKLQLLSKKVSGKEGDNVVIGITSDGRGVVRQSMEVNGETVVYYFIPQAILDADMTVGEIMQNAQTNDLLYDLATNENWSPIVDKLVKLFKEVYGEDNIKAPDATALGEFADTDLRIGVIANLLYNSEFMEISILAYTDEVLQFCGQLPSILEALIDKSENLSDTERKIRNHLNTKVIQDVKELLIRYCSYYFAVTTGPHSHLYGKVGAPHIYELMRTLPIFDSEDIKKIIENTNSKLAPDGIVRELQRKATGVMIDTEVALNTLEKSGVTHDVKLIENFIDWYEGYLAEENSRLTGKTTFADWRKQIEKIQNGAEFDSLSSKEKADFLLAVNEMRAEFAMRKNLYSKYIDPIIDNKTGEYVNLRKSSMNNRLLANGHTMGATLFNKWLAKNRLTMEMLIDFFDNKDITALPQQYQEMYKDLTIEQAQTELQKSFGQMYNFNFDWSKGGTNHIVDRMISEKPRTTTGIEEGENGQQKIGGEVSSPIKQVLGTGKNKMAVDQTDAMFTYLPVKDTGAILHDILADDIPPEFAAFMTLDDIISMPQFVNLDKIKEFIKDRIDHAAYALPKIESDEAGIPQMNGFETNQYKNMYDQIKDIDELYPGNDAFTVIQFYLMTKYAVDVFISDGHAYMFDAVGYGIAFTDKFKRASNYKFNTGTQFPVFMGQRFGRSFVNALKKEGIVKTEVDTYNNVTKQYVMLSDIIDSKYIPQIPGRSDCKIYFITKENAKGAKTNVGKTEKTGIVLGVYKSGLNIIEVNIDHNSLKVSDVLHEITHFFQEENALMEPTTHAHCNNLQKIIEDKQACKEFVGQNHDVINQICEDLIRHSYTKGAPDLRLTSSENVYYQKPENMFYDFLYYGTVIENQAYKNFHLPTFSIRDTLNGNVHEYDISFAWGNTYTLTVPSNTLSRVTTMPNAYLDQDNNYSIETTATAEQIIKEALDNGITSASYDEQYTIAEDIDKFNNEPNKQKAFNDINDKANNRSVVPIETAREEMLNRISDLLNTENLDDTTKTIYQELQKAIDGIKHKGQTVRDTSSYQIAENITTAFQKIESRDLIDAFDNPAYLDAVHHYMYALYCGEHSTLSYDDFLDTPLPSFYVDEWKKGKIQYESKNTSAFIGTIMPTDGNIDIQTIINMGMDTSINRIKRGSLDVSTIRARDVIFVNGDGIAVVNWLAVPVSHNKIEIQSGQLSTDNTIAQSSAMRLTEMFPTSGLWNENMSDAPETIYISDADGKLHGISMEEFAQRGLYVNEIKNIKSDQIIVDQKNDMIYVLYNDGKTYNMLAETLSHNAHLMTREAWRQKVDQTGAIELGKDTEAELIMDILEKIIYNPNVDIAMRQKVIDAFGERLGQLDQVTNITTPDKVSFTTNDGTRILFPAFTKSKDGRVTITDNSRDDDVHFNATDIKYMHTLDPNRMEQADDTSPEQPAQPAPEEQPERQTSMFDEGDSENPIPNDPIAGTVTPMVIFGKDVSEYLSMSPRDFSLAVSKMSTEEFLTLQSAFDIYLYKSVANNTDMRILPLRQLRIKALTMGTLAYRMADYSNMPALSKNMLQFFKKQADSYGAKRKNGELNSSHTLSDYFLAKSTGKVNDFVNYISSLSFGDMQRLYNELSSCDIANEYLDAAYEKNGGNIENYAVSVKILRQTVNNDLAFINSQLMDSGFNQGLLLKSDVIKADGNSGLSSVDINNLLVLSHDNKVMYVSGLNVKELGAIQVMTLNYYEIMQTAGLDMTLINDLIGVINSEILLRDPPTDKRGALYKTFAKTAARLGKDVSAFQKSIRYNTKNRELYLRLFANRSFGDGIRITGEPLDIYNVLTAAGVNFEATRQSKAESIILKVCELTDPFVATTEGHEYGKTINGDNLKEAKNKEGVTFYATELTSGNNSNTVGYANVLDVLATLADADLNTVMEQTFGLIYQNAMGEKYSNSVTMDYKTYTTVSAKINAMLNAKTKGEQTSKAQAYSQMFYPLIKATAAYKAYSSLFSANGNAATNDIACQLYTAACLPTYYKYDYICNNINESEYGMYYALLKDAIDTMTYSQNNSLKTSLRELLRVFDDVLKNKNNSYTMQNMYDAITKGVIDTNNANKLYSQLKIAMTLINMRTEMLASNAPKETPLELSPRKTALDRDANTPSEVTNVLNGNKYTIKSTRVPRSLAEETNLGNPELGFYDPNSVEPLYLPKRVQGFIVESNFNPNVDKENVICPALINFIKECNGKKTKGKRGSNVTSGTMHFTEENAVDFIRRTSEKEINDYTYRQLNKWFFQNPNISTFQELDALTVYAEQIWIAEYIIRNSTQLPEGINLSELYNPNMKFSTASLNELYSIINNSNALKALIDKAERRLEYYIDPEHSTSPVGRTIYEGNLRTIILNHYQSGTFAELKHAMDLQFWLSESEGRSHTNKTNEEGQPRTPFIGSTPERQPRDTAENNNPGTFFTPQGEQVGPFSSVDEETATRMAERMEEISRGNEKIIKRAVREELAREIFIEKFRAEHPDGMFERMSDESIWETQWDELSENEKVQFIRQYVNPVLNQYTPVELIKAYWLAAEYQNGEVDMRNLKTLNPYDNAMINEALLKAFGEENMTSRTGGVAKPKTAHTWTPPKEEKNKPYASNPEPEPAPEPTPVPVSRQRQSVRAAISKDINYLANRMAILDTKLLQKNHPNLFTYNEKTKKYDFITKDVMDGKSTLSLEMLARELRDARAEYMTGTYGPKELKKALENPKADKAAEKAEEKHQKELAKVRQAALAAIDRTQRLANDKLAKANEKYQKLLEEHNALKKQLQAEHKSTRSIVKQVKDTNISIILTSDTDTPVPELLVNILNTTLDELNTSNRNVQFVTNNENFENIALNMKKFFEANEALFAHATQKEWEDVINFLFQSTLGNNMFTADANLTSEDKCNSTKAYEIFTLWTLTWLKKMQGAGNYAFDDRMSARLEAAYSNRASFGGAYLQAVAQAVDFLNPYKDIAAWLADEYNIEIKSEDLQGFAEAVMWELGSTHDREELLKVGVPVNSLNDILNGKEEIILDEHNKAKIVGEILKVKAAYWLPGIKNANSGHPFEKLFAWEQMCLLSWPGTWIRNVSSNVVLQSLNSVSDQIGRLFGKGKRTQARMERIQEYVNEKNDTREAQTTFFMYNIAGTHPTQEMFDAVDNLFNSVLSVNPVTGNEETFWQILSNSSTKYSDMARTATGQKMSNGERLVALVTNSMMKRLRAENRFSTHDKWVKTDKKTGGDVIKEKSKFNANKEKVLNKTSNLLFKALSDDPWIKRTTRKLFTRMLTERGISPSAVKFNDNVVLDIFADAYTEASWQYMHKKSPMHALDESIKKKLGDGGWFVWKQLMPFANATWNWGMEALNFSPIGLIRGIVQLCRLDKNYIKNDMLLDMGESVPSGNLSLYNARKMIGKGVVGTFLFALGAGAAALGIIGIDKNDDKIKLYFGNDTYLDVSSLFGTSSFLAGAGFIYTMCCTDDDESGKLWAAISSVLDSLFDDSIFNDFLNSFEYSTSIGDWITYNVVNAFSAFVPNLYRKVVENSYDFTIQYDSGILGQIEKLGTKIIPGLAYAFPKKYDIYTGEAVSTYRIPFLWKWVNSLSPIDWEPYNVSTQEQIARALGVNKGLLTGDYDDIGKLTTEQKVFLNEMYGKLNKQSLEELMANKKAVNVQNEDGTYSTLKWRNMTDKQKAAAINSLMTKNASYAKTYTYVTYMGGKYYASESEYAELRKLGITKNVYLATSTKSGYV